MRWESEKEGRVRWGRKDGWKDGNHGTPGHRNQLGKRHIRIWCEVLMIWSSVSPQTGPQRRPSTVSSLSTLRSFTPSTFPRPPTHTPTHPPAPPHTPFAYSIYLLVRTLTLHSRIRGCHNAPRSSRRSAFQLLPIHPLYTLYILGYKPIQPTLHIHYIMTTYGKHF